jgi:hypothetical protein
MKNTKAEKYLDSISYRIFSVYYECKIQYFIKSAVGIFFLKILSKLKLI